VAAALLLAGALYFPALRGAFISDDRVVVAGNPATESPAAAMLAFARPFWHGLKSANPYYRPLPVLSWALDRSVAGGSTIPYHASSIALHAINALLAAWLVGVLIGWRRALPGAGAAGMAIAAALVVAHPIHTEPVAAIYGRPDLLSATGVLLFLNFALRGRAIAAFVALGAALLSKESAILIPLLAPVIFGAGRELLARSGAGRATATAAPLPALHRHPLLLGVAGAGIVGGIYLSLRHAALGALVDPGPVSRLDNPLAAAGSVERWMTPFAVAARSAALWLRPTPLCADRGFDVTPIASGPGDPAVLPGAILIAGAVAAAALLAARRSPWALVPAAAILTWLPGSGLPVLSPVIMAERLLYMPSIFACVAAGGLAAGMARRAAGWSPRGRSALPPFERGGLWAALALMVAVATIFAGLTRSRAADFADEISFYRADTLACPRSAKARYNLGNALARAGRLEEAAGEFERSGAIAPWLGVAHANLGATLLGLGRVDPAGEAYRRAIEADPALVSARASLAGVLFMQGRSSEALVEAEAALRLRPSPEDAGQIRELIAWIRNASQARPLTPP
jgi:hypothetical protein